MRKRAASLGTPCGRPRDPYGRAIRTLDAQNRLLMQHELLRLWHGTGKTIVLVTHDLVEAIAVSDRIVIFTSAPGAIKSIHDVPIGRPRDVFHIHQAVGFTKIYDTVWDELREEIDRARQARGETA